ncbi:MAG TPA: hypothetical protein VFJ76_02540 [Solirubrobacterales bacterium]|nr:hypothetical protein [Solirubrobacterales bacterium]
MSEEQIMEKLYSKFAEGLGVSKNAVPGQNFLALCSPGFFLDPAEKADTDPGARYRWTRLLDKVPHASWIYGTTDALVPDVYKIILQEKELPPESLGEQQKKELAAARAVIQDKKGNPTKKFKKFKELRQRYREVLTKFENARLDFQNAGKRIPPHLA